MVDEYHTHTVGETNLAPPWMVESLKIMRSTSYQLVQDFATIHSNNYYPMVTSSTAQGGGGSFKNRKPIGEVGCCESGMAERSH